MSEKYNDPKLKIFALNSNKPLAQRIADENAIAAGKAKAILNAIEESNLKNGFGVYPINTLEAEVDTIKDTTGTGFYQSTPKTDYTPV